MHSAAFLLQSGTVTDLQSMMSLIFYSKIKNYAARKGWRYCQSFFGKPVLSISDFSLIDKPFFLKKHTFGFVNKRKITYWQTLLCEKRGQVYVHTYVRTDPIISSSNQVALDRPPYVRSETATIGLRVKKNPATIGLWVKKNPAALKNSLSRFFK